MSDTTVTRSTQMTWNLADVFETVAAAVPDREAVVCGERRLSYRQLDERATRLARHLQLAGVGPGDRVAVDLYNSPEYLEVVLGAAKLRAAAVNVNYRYTADELHYLLNDAAPRAIVFHGSLAPDLLEACRRLPRLPRLLAVDDGTGIPPEATAYEATLAAAPAGGRFPARAAGDLFLLYTGGTTGMPKGVLWRHDDLLFGILLGPEAPDMREAADLAGRARLGGYRLLPACPLMHGAGLFVALSALFAGGTVVLSADRRLDASRLWRVCADEAVEVLTVVGDAVARPLVDALSASAFDLSRLRVMISSGATLSPGVKDALGSHLPELLIIDTLGSSETGPGARSYSGRTTRAHNTFRVDEHTAVLDDMLRPVEPGSGRVGRLGRSGHVAHGYWNDPAKTAATFPVVDGKRWSMTGDHARVEADGTITLLGRGSGCINTGGEKVYPEEVEGALRTHPAVVDALVVGVSDERWGERIVAVVQPAPGEKAEERALQAHVQRVLARYKVPKNILTTERVERSPAGKPDYHWARQTAMRLLAAAAEDHVPAAVAESGGRDG